MERYKNIGGDSGVYGYEIASDSITVQFLDNSIYLYTYSSAGQLKIEEMKKLALRGYGLNEYINRHVKKYYKTKIR